MQRRLHRSRRSVELGCDVRNGLIEEVVENDDLALSAGKLRQQPVYVDRVCCSRERIPSVSSRHRPEALQRSVFRGPSSETSSSNIQRHHPHPRTEDVDVVPTTEAFTGPRAGFVDRVASGVRIAGDQADGAHQPRVIEHVEVVETPITLHAFEWFHTVMTRRHGRRLHDPPESWPQVLSDTRSRSDPPALQRCRDPAVPCTNLDRRARPGIMTGWAQAAVHGNSVAACSELLS